MKSNIQKTLRAVKKSAKRFRSDVNASMIATLTTAALLPYSVKLVRRGGKDGDDAYVITSLLCETRITPKREDSNGDRTVVSFSLRTPTDIRADLRKLNPKNER